VSLTLIIASRYRKQVLTSNRASAVAVRRSRPHSAARDLFSPAGRRALAEFSASNVLVAFDYDGTLAPIADDPRRAALRSRTRQLLRRVAALYPIAVVSGRREADVARRLDGTGVWVAVGHQVHWLRRSAEHYQVRARVLLWRQQLRRKLRDEAGIRIEDKQFALALHYRQAASPDAALAAIVAALVDIDGARVVYGKRVVNVVPDGTLSKAAILLEIERQFGCSCAVYVGDDTDDEDVFHLRSSTPILTVRVGAANDSAAEYVLPDQHDVDTLLAELCKLRG
jgi:trehalose 6-phosphate phosphatase